ncbi:hypothetical protein PU560_14430 [Georgenia sp. 10Sc9-8]|uniref:Uncharacterized protein n=1 Tax=Georgenia halotolerans TaxID=3028317 RepID=A0ABT5TZZ6_9MICO|nr:hypothetical protein [Georgenia halotolerans]
MRALVYHGPGQKAWEAAAETRALKVLISRRRPRAAVAGPATAARQRLSARSGGRR